MLEGSKSIYSIKRLIKKHGSKMIYKGFDINNKVNVCIKMTPTDNNSVYSEKRMYSYMGNHNNIKKHYETFNKKGNDYIITEWCDKELKNVTIHENDKRSKYKVVSDVVNGLYHLHKLNIVHNDIKIENILFHNNNYKICDFDLSHKLDVDKIRANGTPLYLSPEKLLYKRYDTTSDIFGLGCVMYKLFFNSDYYNTFYENIDILNIKNAIIKKQINKIDLYHYIYTKNCEIKSSDLLPFEKKLLLKTLQFDNRITIKELINDTNYNKMIVCSI